MAPLVSEDKPEAPGPSGSMQFGEATESARLQHEVASRSGSGSPPPSPAPMGAPTPQGQPPAPPVQPAPDTGQRLDMNQVFPPMPELHQQFPWRDAIRAASYHPAAGPGLARFADQIQNQHGPNGSSV